MQKIKEFLTSSVADFASIAVFYALLYTVGLKAAIGGTMLFLAIDAYRRHRMKLGFPRIYLLSSAMVLVFGAIDLFSENPFMIKYEAVISSLVIAAILMWGARGKSIIEQLVEQQEGMPLEGQPDVQRFFQLMTLIWAGYFAAKAVFYYWMGETMPLDRLLELRPVVGIASMIAMVLLMTQARHLFSLLRRWGMLPAGPGL